jgi:Flp pilus assembly protein TadG
MIKATILQRRIAKKRLGVAAVEFAIVAPLFILLTFGILEYGRMVMVQQVLTNAAREGARAAVLDGATIAGVRTGVNNYLTGASVPAASVDVNGGIEPSTLNLGDPVTVTVQLPFGQISWLPSPMYISANRQLRAGCVMRREAAQ